MMQAVVVGMMLGCERLAGPIYVHEGACVALGLLLSV